MSEEGFVCHTCHQVFPGSREYNDHLRSAHQAQQVICPWCPKWAVFSLPGSLRRHVNGQHKGLEGEADLLAVNVAYYFATNPELYRSTTIVKPLQHDVSKRAVAATRLWAQTVQTSESRTLLQKAETDWQYLGAPDPAVKVESTERKRSSEIPPIYSPKKLCISRDIPELEDLRLTAVELTNSFSRVFISWFVRGVFLVNVRLGDQQSHTLLRRMQALPKEGMGSKPMGEGKTVTDTRVLQVLATRIGLPKEDLVTVKLHQECQEQFFLPTSASVTNEVFGAAGVLPAELTSPSESISTNDSLVPISLSPTTGSPSHDTMIAENMQEVPVNRALSPVHSSKPVGDLPLVMERPPALTPTPSSLAHIPQAPLAVVPRPFKNTFSAAHPVEPPARATAFDLLRTGSWPSLCPGRRDWASASITIPLPIQEVTWPPKNWQRMTAAQRRATWQSMAVILSLGDEPTGHFPACDPTIVMDNYSFLALPGSGSTPPATTPADRAMTELRVATHHSLKYALEDSRDQRHLRSLTQGLRAGIGKGPVGRRRVLDQVNAAAVPLRPLRKEVSPTNLMKMAPPTKEKAAVPAYSPTRPGLKQ